MTPSRACPRRRRPPPCPAAVWAAWLLDRNRSVNTSRAALALLAMGAAVLLTVPDHDAHAAAASGCRAVGAGQRSWPRAAASRRSP
jgi:hypothetical protein